MESLKPNKRLHEIVDEIILKEKLVSSYFLEGEQLWPAKQASSGSPQFEDWGTCLSWRSASVRKRLVQALWDHFYIIFYFDQLWESINLGI